MCLVHKILIFLYVVSVLMTIAAFYGMNYMTEPVRDDDFRGSNGNPAFFIAAVGMPFILYFLYGTVELSMRAADKWLSQKGSLLGILISTSFILVASLITFNRAIEYRKYIVATKDAYSNPQQFALFNVFSNHLFFNPLTFMLALACCFLIGTIWSFVRGKKRLIT